MCELCVSVRVSMCELCVSVRVSMCELCVSVRVSMCEHACSMLRKCAFFRLQRFHCLLGILESQTALLVEALSHFRLSD